MKKKTLRFSNASAKPAALAPGQVHLVEFQSGVDRYALEMTSIQEVQPLGSQAWCPLPAAPPFVVGVVNLRGRIYSILDLSAFFGQPSRPIVAEAHLLLVRADIGPGEEERALCLLADTRPLIIPVNLSDLQPVPSGPAQPFLRGATQEMVVLLDLERLLADPGLIVFDEI